MFIPKIDPAQLEALVASGAVAIDVVKSIVLQVANLFKAAAAIQDLFTAHPELQQAISAPPISGVPDGPVDWDTVGTWTPVGHWLTDTEISNRVNKMSEAIAAENWIQGFAFAVQILSMAMAGGAS